MSGGKYDVTLQLKSEVSQLSGQNSELRSRLAHCEVALSTAIKLVERKECEVNRVHVRVPPLVIKARHLSDSDFYTSTSVADLGFLQGGFQ